MAKQVNTHFGLQEPFESFDFTDYSERLNSYPITNNIGQCADDASEEVKQAEDKKKVAVTISLIGKGRYSALKDLYLPGLPADKLCGEITTILKGFYNPKVLEVAETCISDQTVKKSESVTEYATS